MFKTINGGKLPTRGSKYSACVDLYANEDVVIGAGETKMIGLGVAIDENELNYLIDQYYLSKKIDVFEHRKQFMESHYLSIKPRSSLRAKGLISHSGVIDLDFFGRELKIIIHNPWQGDDMNMSGYDEWGAYYNIKKGDKIAQITLLEHKSWLLGIESEKVRDGGFGSTDKN